MEKICKNCKNWTPNMEAEESWQVYLTTKQICNKHGYIETVEDDIPPINSMALSCVHDGPIYTGPKFGCNGWEKK